MVISFAILPDHALGFRNLRTKRQLLESVEPRYNLAELVSESQMSHLRYIITDRGVTPDLVSPLCISRSIVFEERALMEEQLAKKLRIQPGQRMLVLNAPPGFVESLGQFPAGTTLSTDDLNGSFDFVQVFAKDQAELNQLKATAIGAVTHDGLFWVCYPKKSSKIKSDLMRDNLWDRFEGLRPVSQIAIDDTWSAMRFRPVAGSRKGAENAE